MQTAVLWYIMEAKSKGKGIGIMKKMLGRAALLLVAIAILMSAFASLALAESAYVEATGRVNVRRGASLDDRVLGAVEKGTRLTYREESETDDRGVVWYKVRYNSTTDGWISSRYSKLVNYDQKVTATGGQTYIRSEGSLYGNRLGVLPKGESATYLNESEVDDRGVAWYRVSYDGVKGWVSSRYTRLGSGTSYTRKVTAADGQTNIRSKGSLYGEIQGVLPKGGSATYLEDSAVDDRGVTWYKVRYDGVTGWVSSRYTTLK